MRAEALRKTFGPLHALAGLDLEVPGGIAAFLGPNGAGKTTLMRILATLSRPDSGRIWLNGIDVLEAPQRIRRHVGLAGQNVAVVDSMTGLENLRMVARLRGLRYRAARLAVRDIVDELALGEVAGRLVRTYSGGMRRRLDLGIALLGSPSVLLLDEPTTGLDPQSRRSFWDAVRRRCAEGTDVLMTTQHLDEVDHLARHVVVIDHGAVVASGSPVGLREQSGETALHISVERADLETAVRTVGDRLDVTAVDDVRGEVTAAGEVTAPLLAQLLREMVECGVDVRGLEVRRPTLEEILIKLTGRTPEPEAVRS